MAYRSVLVGLAVLLSMTGCASDNKPAQPHKTKAASACARKPGRVTADVDGDGYRDVVWRGYVGGDPVTGELVVGVCTKKISTTVPVGGMNDGEFRAIDIDQNGRSEIVSGGTTVSQAISEIVVFVGQRLVSVPDLYVADGPAQFAELNGEYVPSVMEQWGCEDFDEDGTRDLVVVSTTRQPKGATEHLEAYRIVAGAAHRLGSREQALDHMPNFNERLVASC